MTLMGKATAKGLEGVARAVLAPHFHTQSDDDSPKKVRRESASFSLFHSHLAILYRLLAQPIILQIPSASLPHAL